MRIILGSLAAVGLLVLLNLAATRVALGLESSDAHFQKIRDLIPPVDQVLAFASSGSREERLASFGRIAGRLDFSGSMPVPGKAGSEFLIPIERIAELNSYPLILWQMAPQYEENLSYLSLKYAEPSGAVFQYSYYCGESDTTPSRLVPKVRRSPGEGDYFVCYSLLVDFDKNAVVKPVLWRAYRGGSYNGFEEVTLFGALSLIEALFILGGWAYLRRGTRREQLT